MAHENGRPKERGRRLDKKLLLQMFSQVSAPPKKETAPETEEANAKGAPESNLPKNGFPKSKE